MRSLTLKWIATLLVTSLVGVGLVGLLAYRATVNEFDLLRMEQLKASFTADIATYYQNNGTWDGLVDWFFAQAVLSADQDDPPPLEFGTVVDNNGNVVLGSRPFEVGDQLQADMLGDGTPIIVSGERVGTIFVNAPPGPDVRQQSYIFRTTRALIIAAIGSGVTALLFGLLLSRHFLRPLMELTKAITAMKQGDLHQQVQIRSNDELGELAQTFNQMSTQLYRANQLRKQMTADIAHDLRTPLMVITGYIEALRDGTLKPTLERFEAMNREALLLKRLVDDLRTLSLADAGELKLVYQLVQPGELLQHVKQAFEPLADEQQVELLIQIDDNLPDLRIDRERMVQVLGNLVTNALHYTSSGGVVALLAQKRPGGVQLVVRDTGVGIPEDKLPNIFERFYRIEESRSESLNESGLGLAIAKSIVEAHQGTISAESRVGQGTSVTINLFAAPAV